MEVEDAPISFPVMEHQLKRRIDDPPVPVRLVAHSAPRLEAEELPGANVRAASAARGALGGEGLWL
jgi:hypothetical protein